MTYICEYCGKEHNGIYGTKRFCSESCAKSYSAHQNLNKKHIVKCKYCGKEIVVSVNCPKQDFWCDDCKQIHSLTSQPYIKCHICGRLHKRKHKCENEFCNQHNIQQFKSLIKYFGFNKSKYGTEEVENEFNKIRTKLYNLYWVDHLSSTEICKKFNYPSAANLTAKIFKYLNIQSKNVSHAICENYLYDRSQIYSSKKYNDTWHITWDGKEVYLRSSYEEDYANELDKNKIVYDVEAFRIKYYDSINKKFRCAIPDFYLLHTNTLVEIKSIYTLGGEKGIINLNDKFKEYKKLGYNCKLIIEHKEYNLCDLPKDPIWDKATKSIISAKDANHSGKSGWKLMTKDGISRRINNERVNEYISNGWKLGK